MNIRTFFYKSLRILFFTGLMFILTLAVVGATIRWYFIPQLPSTENLKEVRLQSPLRVYTSDRKLIGEFGEARRIPLAFEQFPKILIEAFLAAEDKRFYEHGGVNIKSLMRAAINLMRTGKIEQGGSTITMQMARNYLLPEEKSKKSYTRKLKEILLAVQIEQELTKEEILELYLNIIFLGHRAYGIGAAAQVYYGKTVQELTLPELAMLAGLPKAPSFNNPLTNPEKAIERRNYVLQRMYELRSITREVYEEAIASPNTARLYKPTLEADAAYVAEMVRDYMVKRFNEEQAYTAGYQVITTIDTALQEKGQTALRNALFDYDERHGYRGPLHHVDLKGTEENFDAVLEPFEKHGGLLPSVVLEVKPKDVVAYNPTAGRVTIAWKDLAWGRPYIHDNKQGAAPRSAGNIVKRGDIIMLREVGKKRPVIEVPAVDEEATGKGNEVAHKVAEEKPAPEVSSRWRLAQVPQVEGALVSLQAENGAIIALNGGFDFYHSKFNRVTQAKRQPGSSFKPFIYSAALERGFTPASMINDAPLSFKVGNKVWRPLNYSQRFYGPTSLRDGLTHSRNLVSVRLLMQVGVSFTIKHAAHFGFNAQELPENLSIALGTPDLTPLEMARAYTVFANGGYLIEPHFIQRIEDLDGKIISTVNPTVACVSCLETQPSANPTTCMACPEAPPAIVEEKETLIPVKQSQPPTTTVPEFEALCLGCPMHWVNNGEEFTVRTASRTIELRNAWVMTSLLKDVIRRGTGQAARALKREDVAGKTGTTNEARDAWFCGYNPEIVTVNWVGFDQPRSLGSRETGGRAALPMWIEFMEAALKDRPLKSLPRPTKLKTVRAREDSSFETFYSETAPAPRPKKPTPATNSTSTNKETKSKPSAPPLIPEQLW